MDRGINYFEIDNAVNVLGNFNMISSLEVEDTLLVNHGTLTVGANMNYIGGNGDDDITAGAGVSIAGVLYIDLAESTKIANPQVVDLSGLSAGRLAVEGGNSPGGNEVVTDAATSIAGDVSVVFENSTMPNTGILLGSYGGVNGTFRGGSAQDSLTVGAIAASMNSVVLMGADSDTITLESTASFASAVLNFGDGIDVFNDNLGMPYPFPVVIQNLP